MSAFDSLDDEESDIVFGDYPNVDERSCRLLGPTALIVQALMGFLVVSSLLYKRHREKPKRPWKIWMFDVSKQIAGQAFVHGVNVLISDVAAHHSSKNPCVVYFLNILIDTTLGVGVIYLLIHVATNVLTIKLRMNGFRTGQYGDPPSFSYWARQAVVYVLSLTTMKLLVVGLFAAWPGITKIGAWLLSWTGGGDAAQVIVVMGLFPIIMNILQFWLIDSIVKASNPDSLPLANNSAGDSSDQEPLFSSRDSDGEDEGEGAAVARHHDVENPRPRSRSSQSRPHSFVSTKSSSDSDERKYLPSSGAPSTPIESNINHLAHEYPPTSTSPDNCSVYSSGRQSPIGFPSKRSIKRYIPPPLHLSSATNSYASSSSIVAIGSTPLSTSRSSGSPTMFSPPSEKHLIHERTQSWHGAIHS